MTIPAVPNLSGLSGAQQLAAWRQWRAAIFGGNPNPDPQTVAAVTGQMTAAQKAFWNGPNPRPGDARFLASSGGQYSDAFSPEADQAFVNDQTHYDVGSGQTEKNKGLFDLPETGIQIGLGAALGGLGAFNPAGGGGPSPNVTGDTGPTNYPNSWAENPPPTNSPSGASGFFSNPSTYAGLAGPVAGLIGGIYGANASSNAVTEAAKITAAANLQAAQLAAQSAAQQLAFTKSQTQLSLDQYNAQQQRLTPYRNLGQFAMGEPDLPSPAPLRLTDFPSTTPTPGPSTSSSGAPTSSSQASSGPAQLPPGVDPNDPVVQAVAKHYQQLGLQPTGRGTGPTDIAYYVDQIKATGGLTPDNSGYWLGTNGQGGRIAQDAGRSGAASAASSSAPTQARSLLSFGPPLPPQGSPNAPLTLVG